MTGNDNQETSNKSIGSQIHTDLQILHKDFEILAKWLESIYEEQVDQTHYLRNISGWATFFMVLIIVGLILGLINLVNYY